jgi:hypothetical protein
MDSGRASDLQTELVDQMRMLAIDKVYLSPTGVKL